jgi:ketosteroid isomerase-like protein
VSRPGVAHPTRDTERAMSQEDVELLRQGFEDFARGDLDAVLERLDPDVDWRPAIAPILGVEKVRGREAVREFFTRELYEGFDEFRAEPVAYEDLGDAVLVTVRYIGRGESTALRSTRPSRASTGSGTVRR